MVINPSVFVCQSLILALEESLDPVMVFLWFPWIPSYDSFACALAMSWLAQVTFCFPIAYSYQGCFFANPGQLGGSSWVTSCLIFRGECFPSEISQHSQSAQLVVFQWTSTGPSHSHRSFARFVRALPSVRVSLVVW